MQKHRIGYNIRMQTLTAWVTQYEQQVISGAILNRVSNSSPYKKTNQRLEKPFTVEPAYNSATGEV